MCNMLVFSFVSCPVCKKLNVIFLYDSVHFTGMNATIMYVGHSVAEQMFPWHWHVGTMNTHFILLIENIWGTLLWILVAFWLYRVKFFLSL
jgi:hypothetical protein